ncbi:hypothetical protein HPB52_023322 [Rhipicephalus sanguineus]|uniref:Uncharacterized protein n=1 Tax=Rhipicephalus sanguineus TaxID=34632 RepID=A0A9D4QCE5_RHISA|nr:hypothetical protein HPB52_023322 [Rhipicephalus sanguineus]
MDNSVLDTDAGLSLPAGRERPAVFRRYFGRGCYSGISATSAAVTPSSLNTSFGTNATSLRCKKRTFLPEKAIYLAYWPTTAEPAASTLLWTSVVPQVPVWNALQLYVSAVLTRAWPAFTPSTSPVTFLIVALWPGSVRGSPAPTSFVPKPRGSELLQVIHRCGLLILNSGATTFLRRGSRSSAIDLALASDEGSVHYAITLEWKQPPHRAHMQYDLCGAIPESSDIIAALTDCVASATTRCSVPTETPAPDIKTLNLHCQTIPARRTLDGIQPHRRRLPPPRASARRPELVGALRLIRRPTQQPSNMSNFYGAPAPFPRPVGCVLAELMEDNFAPPSRQRLQRVQLPELPTGNRPELLAPQRFFPTEGILLEIRDLCNTEFTFSKLSLVLDRRKRRSAPGGDGVGETPISLRAVKQAFYHVLRMKGTAHRQHLVERDYSLPRSATGRPSRHVPLKIRKTLPGIKTKASTPVAAIQQECDAHLHSQLAGRTLVYVDGSAAA